MNRPLERGALAFQKCPETATGNAISRVYTGWRNFPINHVAVSLGDGTFVEAIKPSGVVLVAEIDFWNRGEPLIENGPIGLIGRWNAVDPAWIESALAWTILQIGKPYNDAFDVRDDRYYCSQLICDAFRHGAGFPLLPESPMNFQDPQSGEILPHWVEFYRILDRPVPQGQPGSHPAVLSKSSRLNVSSFRTWT